MDFFTLKLLPQSSSSLTQLPSTVTTLSEGSGAELRASDLVLHDLYEVLLGSSSMPVLFAWWPKETAWQHDEIAERCTRCLPGVRPGTDLVALPRLQEVEELWAAWAEEQGMEAWQVLWFDPFPPCQCSSGTEEVLTPPEEALSEVVASLAKCTELGDVLFYPMYVTAQMASAAARFGLTLVGDAANHPICNLESAKAWLHPHINPRRRGPCLRDALPTEAGEGATARGPWGYIASSSRELVEAMHTLQTELPRGARLVLKPSWASGGDGIVVGVTEEQLAAFEFPPVDHHTAILEEFIEGSGESPMLYMIGGTPCGLLGDQILSADGTVNDGNRWPSPTASESLTEKCVSAALEIQRVWGLRSQWGLDFVLSLDGTPIIVDLNMGRPNGNFSVRLWESRLEQRLYLHTSSWEPPAGLTAEAFFQALRARGLTWNPVALEGVIVYQHFQGKYSAYTMASACSWDAVGSLLARLQELMIDLRAAAAA